MLTFQRSFRVIIHPSWFRVYLMMIDFLALKPGENPRDMHLKEEWSVGSAKHMAGLMLV